MCFYGARYPAPFFFSGVLLRMPENGIPWRLTHINGTTVTDDTMDLVGGLPPPGRT